MALRPFKMPDDAAAFLDIIPVAFQYPENEAWSVQEDEMQNLVDSIKSMRRLWWLIRLLGVVVPPLKDVFRGFVWEEDGKPVGLTNAARHGTTDSWVIGNVAVLPEYRRRGIARQLVQSCIELAKEHGAQTITLDVVDGNIPAYTLYEKLGFTHFSGSNILELESTQFAEQSMEPLPPGYELIPLKMSNWRPRFELAQRITPDIVAQYEPVEEKRYRQPRVLLLLLPVFLRAFGMKIQRHAILADGRIVGMCGYAGRTRSGGVNEIFLQLDPAHVHLAPCLLKRIVGDVLEASPDRRVEFTVPHWQPTIIETTEQMGFAFRYGYHAMGMKVN